MTTTKKRRSQAKPKWSNRRAWEVKLHDTVRYHQLKASRIVRVEEHLITRDLTFTGRNGVTISVRPGARVGVGV